MRTTRKPKSGIYGIISKKTGKVYVGSSKDTYKRILAHKAALRLQYHNNQHMLRHFNMYGEDDFSYGVLEFCDETKLQDREEYWCAYFDVHDKDFGFNIASIDRSKGFSDEHRHKISDAKMGHTVSEETRAKLREAYIKNPPPQPSKSVRSLSQKLAVERGTCSVLKLAGINAKEYKVTSPDGEVYVIKNLKKFARDHELSYPGLHKVCTGLRKHYKGWKCEHYNEE